MSSDPADPGLLELIEEQTQEIASVRAALELLLEILIKRGDLAAGHERLVQKVMQRARRASSPRVHLNVLQDKYALTGADVDCASLLHLCKGRCCALKITLSVQDVEEQRLRWEIERPYLLRKEADGYCTHFDRARGGCTVYEHRPATCRVYDCRGDQRIWRDFEKKIPADMPLGVIAPEL